MIKYLFIFLLLSSVAIPDILVTPTKEFVFTKFGVFLFTGKLIAKGQIDVSEKDDARRYAAIGLIKSEAYL